MKTESWSIVALHTLAGGIAGALLAVVPGFIDMLSLDGAIKRGKMVYEHGVGVGHGS